MQRKNTEPYITRYLHAKGRRLGLPISGNFELTARCNFNCPMCYVHLQQSDIDARGRELTAEQWIDLARQARDQGMVFALLTGGEPFVRKDFFTIYSAMKNMGLLVSINSNGSLLSGEILERLKENPPARMNISLYGGSNETYKKMCGLDAFDRVTGNIRALKQAGIEVCINLSITPQNCHDLHKIHAAAKELGAPVRASSYMYPSIRVNGGQYGCGNRLSAEDAARYGVEWDQLRFTWKEFCQRAESMHRLEAVDVPECPVESESGVACRAGSSAFWMTWDGRMLPCGMMPGPEAYPLRSGFSAAWQEIREKTAQIRLPVQCSVCPKKDVCPACAAVCVTETGAFDGVPTYVCRQTEEMIRCTWEAGQKREEER